MRVVPVPVLMDNYAYLVIEEASGEAAVVDPSEAAPVLDAAKREGVRLRAIWNTHHHWDHVGGNRDLLVAAPDLKVFGYAEDRSRIPGITDPVEDGGEFSFGDLRVRVIFIPAHTSGHVAYHLPEEAMVFTGDTLFAGGCGRLFEGDAQTMVDSLGRLASLPPQTRIYCGHEYTEKNLAFALTLEPGNRALRDKYERVRQVRGRGEPTVPSTIGEELSTNPFLRSRSDEIRRTILERFPGESDDPVAVFARTRELKDQF
ncbi:MAG: hydroxyacylglutathione hydrolase [Candidatus Binatia bacterium]